MVFRGCDTSYKVSVHILCRASIYTLSLCRGHSWRVRLAKKETLTPPGHLVSPLVCRGPWMSTVVLYCWCHSDSASYVFHCVCITCHVKALSHTSCDFYCFPLFSRLSVPFRAIDVIVTSWVLPDTHSATIRYSILRNVFVHYAKNRSFFASLTLFCGLFF